MIEKINGHVRCYRDLVTATNAIGRILVNQGTLEAEEERLMLATVRALWKVRRGVTRRTGVSTLGVVS